MWRAALPSRYIQTSDPQVRPRRSDAWVQPKRTMIRRLVDFALDSRFLVAIFAVLLFIWGYISFKNLPIEAYPDVANNYVQVITQWPGRAAEEVEQQVTVPLEIVMNGIPHLPVSYTHLDVYKRQLQDLLAVPVVFRVVVENQHEAGQPEQRHRPQMLQVRDAVHDDFERHGDLLFHLSLIHI